MAPAHESETIVFNFRKLLSTLPNYAELEQILLFSVNWGKQVWAILASDWLNVLPTKFQLIWPNGLQKIFFNWPNKNCQRPC
jgi:hypothetical protein